MKLQGQSGLSQIVALVAIICLALATLIAVKMAVQKQQTYQGYAQSSGVTLYLQPQSQSIGLTSTFTTQIRLNSNSQPVNAVQANLVYPADKIDFVSIDGAGSAYSLAAQETGGNGIVVISRGSATPTTNDQLLATVTWKTKTMAGSFAISFRGDSAIVSSLTSLNIATGFGNGTYTVTAPALPSATAVPSQTVAPTVKPTVLPTISATAVPLSTPAATVVPTPVRISPLPQPIGGNSVPAANQDGQRAQANNPNQGNPANAIKPCTDSPPLSAPNLFRIDAAKTSVTLYFGPATDPVSAYYITYGYQNGDDLFGASFNQGHAAGVLTYAINQLNPNTTYYFKVRAANGCMPGAWSKTIMAKTSASDTTASAAKPSFTQKLPTVVTKKTEQTFQSLKPNATAVAVSNKPVQPTQPAIATLPPKPNAPVHKQNFISRFFTVIFDLFNDLFHFKK